MSAVGLGQCLKYGEYKTNTKRRQRQRQIKAKTKDKRKKKLYNIENCHTSQIK